MVTKRGPKKVTRKPKATHLKGASVIGKRSKIEVRFEEDLYQSLTLLARDKLGVTVQGFVAMGTIQLAAMIQVLLKSGKTRREIKKALRENFDNWMTALPDDESGTSS